MKKVLKYVLIGLGSFLLILAAHFFIVKKLNQKAMEMANFHPNEDLTATPYLVPSRFLDGERFFAKIPTIGGDTILGFCDTGGGLSMLMPAKKDNPAVKPLVKTGILKGFMPVDYILFKDMVPDLHFPKPSPMPNFVLRKPFAQIKQPYLVIPPENEELGMITEKMPQMGAFLGQNFFVGKSWTFDYITQKIWLNTPLKKSESNNPNVQSLGFKKNSKHVSVYGHPSMTIEVAGESIDVLFDTGASFVLSEDGQRLFNTSKETLGGSFIAASLFEEWKEKHPDWKIYPKSDLSRDIIEVPSVTIGEYTVGPVLFAKRPDENWSEGMIRSMDKVVKGAIGGSALQYFKVTIDYNAELIRFERQSSSFGTIPTSN